MCCTLNLFSMWSFNQIRSFKFSAWHFQSHFPLLCLVLHILACVFFLILHERSLVVTFPYYFLNLHLKFITTCFYQQFFDIMSVLSRFEAFRDNSLRMLESVNNLQQKALLCFNTVVALVLVEAFLNFKSRLYPSLALSPIIWIMRVGNASTQRLGDARLLRVLCF